jgi:hypothetical protein
VRALPISRYLEMPRETVRRHMGRLVTLGLFERAEDQTFVPTEELRRLRSSERDDCFARELRDYCDYPWRLYVDLGATGPAAWRFLPRSAAPSLANWQFVPAQPNPQR